MITIIMSLASKRSNLQQIASSSFRLLAMTACIVAIIINMSTSHVVASKPILQIASLADVIEPLMPTVVNIYTVKYNDTKNTDNSSLSGLLSFEELNDFFKKFNISFSPDLHSNSKATSLGSGFIIDETGLIVTNYHVIADSDEIHVKLSDNTEFPAKIIGKDPRTDLALIKIDSKEKLPFLSFGDSSTVREGDVVIAIGNSLGFGGTVTIGVISSKSRDLGSEVDELIGDFIQTDANINTGNSGGPLFNIEGKVIAINTSIPAVAGGANVGIGFAIPSNRVVNIVNQLKKNGKVIRGRLDVVIQEINTALSEALNLQKDYGVLIVEAKAGGSAEKAGLQSGDVITEFDDKKVINSRKLELFVAETTIGDEVKLTIVRNGEILTLNAIIGPVDDMSSEVTKSDEVAPVDIHYENLLTISNVSFTNLSDDVREQFTIDLNIKGIIVVKIEKDDIKTGLIAGDVVLAINQEHIDNIDEFDIIYKKLKSSDKKTTILLVKRGEFNMFIALPIN